MKDPTLDILEKLEEGLCTPRRLEQFESRTELVYSASQLANFRTTISLLRKSFRSLTFMNADLEKAVKSLQAKLHALERGYPANGYPDDAPARLVLVELLKFLDGWIGDVRVMGNVRAKDARRAIRELLKWSNEQQTERTDMGSDVDSGREAFDQRSCPCPTRALSVSGKRAVTAEDVEAAIVEELDYKLGDKTTVVLLKLWNGFEVIGKSGCVDPANYNHEIGKVVARRRAVDEVWVLEGYRLQCELATAAEMGHGPKSEVATA